MNVASHLAYNKRTEIVISRALGKRALGKPQARKKGPAQARVKRRV
ncbi:hypothetical protein [Corynebacterium glucuronolyticum]|nr:hypothetical protein [Corynebacterium glucuronolyticum]MCT1442965.1 hypothetical protein [Corynebacterium glucuronolyticum]